jgi:glucosyl-3-phosphoglycerate synthase
MSNDHLTGAMGQDEPRHLPGDAMEAGRDAFARRTHHHRDFDARALQQCKRDGGHRISVVIPAKNEEATVGHVVGTLRSTLVDEVELIDELLVVDADSTDATGEVARAAGARVVRQAEVLPAAGNRPGKGEAMWKGLAATTGNVRDLQMRLLVRWSPG